MRIGTAFSSFFKILFNKDFCQQVRSLGEPAAIEAPKPEKKPEPPPKPKQPEKAKRSEALTLLAILQREARFVDFICESIDAYEDAQIGAAVREMHRGCKTVLDRVFDVHPVAADEEGATIDLPTEIDANEFRLTGNVTDQSPSQGTVVHHGWKARKTDLPTWSGGETARLVIAPAEIEV